MTFSFDPNAALLIVTATLVGPSGDTTIRLALDTGASTTLINRDLLILVGYDLDTAINTIPVVTGSRVEHVATIEVAKLKALGIAMEPLEVLAHTLPEIATVDGVLGLDFLRERRLTIDFRNGTLDVD